MNGRIFINYRRGDDPGHTGRLFDRLQDAFEPDQLFMDVDSIAPGLDFVRVLEEQVSKCDVLLAVIGKGWIDARDIAGNRRLDNVEDFVRIEIEAGLRLGKRVIPVLVNDAEMPRAEQMPEDLKPLARRNAVRLSHDRFKSDAQGLIKALSAALEEVDKARQEQVAAAARERAEADARAKEAERRRDDEQRRASMAGLSSEQIAKAEELANWEFIKDSQRAQDFRDHLARFPGGVVERIARAKLATIAWRALGDAPTKDALGSYLEEFPDGPYSEQARETLAGLERPAVADQRQVEREAYEAAKRSDTSVAMAKFLAAYPHGQLSSDALAAHAALIAREEGQRRALASNDPAVLSAFLDSYPNSDHAAEIRSRLASLGPAKTVKQGSRLKIAIGASIGATVLAAVAIFLLWRASPPAGFLQIGGPDPIVFTGIQGGPFNPGRVSLPLTATGGGLRWGTVGAMPQWLSLSPSQGELAANGTAEIVVMPAPSAQSLWPQQFDGQFTLKNFSSGDETTRSVKMIVQARPASVLCAILVSSRPAQPLTAGEECGLKPKDTFKECPTCPEMLVAPAGRFTMGTPDGELERRPSEGPLHTVSFAKTFAVSRFAVTFDEWDACVADGGCNSFKADDYGWGRGRRPVVGVLWANAKAYVAWLSKRTGRTYRLLSEAEREYITRAGTTTAFWWGASISTSQANYDGSTAYAGGQKGEHRAKTVPVDMFQPNAWGFYNVHGNVWDWIEDCWNDTYAGAPTDGSAWTTGICERRALRGGSWYSDPASLRSGFRGWNNTDIRASNYGIRVARSLN